MNKANQTMNDAIRRAAGKTRTTQTPQIPQTGVGSADGGAGMGQQTKLSTNDAMNQLIRIMHKGG